MFLRSHALMLNASILAMSGIVFAKADGKGSGTPPAPVLAGTDTTPPAPVLAGDAAPPAPAPTPAAAPGPVAAATASKREAPEIGEIADVFAKPAAPVRKPRGGKPSYPFEKLNVGQSFPVFNKTLKNVASTVTSCNKRQPNVTLEGQFVEITLPDGSKAQAQKTGKAKVFSAALVPAGNYSGKDMPEHVRVWRDA